MYCVVRKLPESVVSTFRGVVEAIPSEWRLGMFGETPAPKQHHHHVTLLTRIPSTSQASLAAAVASEPPIASVMFGNLFISHVERIKHHKVLCLGIHIVSPQLRALRERLSSAVGGADLRYAGDGHISICYVSAEHAAELDTFLHSSDHPAAIALRAVPGITFTIDELSLNLGPGTPEQPLCLLGDH